MRQRRMVSFPRQEKAGKSDPGPGDVVFAQRPERWMGERRAEALRPSRLIGLFRQKRITPRPGPPEPHSARRRGVSELPFVRVVSTVLPSPGSVPTPLRPRRIQAARQVLPNRHIRRRANRRMRLTIRSGLRGCRQRKRHARRLGDDLFPIYRTTLSLRVRSTSSHRFILTMRIGVACSARLVCAA